MKLSLPASALWLWQRVFDIRKSAGSIRLALLGTTLQMGIRGALFTFASGPFHPSHRGFALAFGSTTLQGQKLAGIATGVPAALPYLAAALHRAWPGPGEPVGGGRWSG